MDSTVTKITSLFTGRVLADHLVNFGGRLVGAIIVLIIGMLVIKAFSTILRSAIRRTIPDHTVRRYSTSAATILLWIVLILILLGVFGIETTSLAALLGAAGLAIGLALQGTLSNFAAGFMLMLFRPFKAGDSIEVAGVAGTAIEIGIFTSIIDMPDNVRAFVPNSMIFNGIIKNRSLNEYLRVEMKVVIAGNSDVTRAQQVIQRLLAQNELVLDVPRPEVQVLENESTGIAIGIWPYTRVKNADAVRTTVVRELRNELESAGIEVLRQ